MLKQVVREVTEAVVPAFVDENKRLHPPGELARRLLALPLDVIARMQMLRERANLEHEPPVAQPTTPAAGSAQPTHSTDTQDTGATVLARSEALTADRPLIVEHEGQEVALFRVDGRCYALSNHCAHAGGPLGEGDVDGLSVTCPYHGWVYDLATGKCTSMPGEHVARYDVEEVGGEIRLKR